MKKYFRFLISLALMLALVYGLNTKWGNIPPLGRLLDPFHGFWQNAESTANPANDELDLPGLQDEVKVIWDDHRVPHIFANNEYDLYYVQGYLTARDRLWQMDIETRLAAGRLSEVVGPKALKTDRYFRRIGMVWVAQKMVQLMAEDSVCFNIMIAYRDGINQYISELDYADYPVEFKLMDYEPEPWTLLKSALIVKFMAFDLAWRDDDLELTHTRQLLGDSLYYELFPDFPGAPDPIIPKGTPWDFEPLNPDSAAARITGAGVAYQRVWRPDRNNGSNNWAVAGSKTASGNPILCNDPHLGLNLPSLWYQIQLNAPGMNVYGVSLPGTPAVIIGFTDSIAWGLTYAARDVKDWYKIQFRDKRRKQYLYDSQWKDTRMEIDTYRVRGQGLFIDTLVYTHHGPVVFDRSFPGDTSEIGLAARWTAHEPTNELRAIYLLNKAKNYRDYLTALPYFSTPGQNFVYADRKGNIAIWCQGLFPLRRKEHGRFILDGSNPADEWPGFIPSEHNPHILNPERGFVSSANQHPTDSTYPYYYSGDFEYYRNQRINQVLGGLDSITPSDMMDLQNDNFSWLAGNCLSRMIDMLDPSIIQSGQEERLESLKNWNRYLDADTKAATLWELWWREFYYLACDELDKPNEHLALPEYYIIEQLFLNHPDHPIFDLENTSRKETARDIVNLAWELAMDSLDNWIRENGSDYSWWRFKNTRLTHLSRSLEPFNVTGLKIGGFRGAVNATQSTHGPSWRMVVSMDKDSIRAWGIYPGGQSGNPGSYWYDNWAKPWAAGRYNRIRFWASPVQKDNVLFTETYSPK